MTRDEFISQIVILQNVFPGKFDVTNANVDVWYKYLGWFDADVFEFAVNNWIMNERTAPSVAEIRKYSFDAREKKLTHPEQWSWERNKQWTTMV